jgi:cellulose synthase/poly-beta-1,6-N-acetylglucosamine synthase-like glycosyltransferase
MRVLFWCSAAFVFYVYLGYPLLLAIWAKRVRSTTPAAPQEAEDDELPGISIVIATRNEAPRLPRRIRNLLSADYPADRRQIIVVSDGSTDGTSRVVAPFADRIDFIPLHQGGKAAALNAGVARARHEILVFADARQPFTPDAMRALVAPFADPRVGGVTGELVLGCEPGGRRQRADRRSSAAPAPIERRSMWERRRDLASTIADGIGVYWRYEKLLRRLESTVGSTLGATGAIYALRRSLWRPLPPGTILDDVLAPMRAVLAGSRVVFNEDAKAFDQTAADSNEESRRKVRTLAGNFQILALEPRLLVPIVNPVWLQYMSHKVGRLFAPYALLMLYATSVALVRDHAVYAIACAGQTAFYLLGVYGAWLERERRAAEDDAAAPARARAAEPARAVHSAAASRPRLAVSGGGRRRHQTEAFDA